MNASRRHFLRSASALAAAVPGARASLSMGLAGLAAMASQSSSAASTSDGYRALVCVYFAGGNDSHNWVVPFDAKSLGQYRSARDELAWPTARLAAIPHQSQSAGREFAMPLELGPLRERYLAGQAAVLANVGPLLRPTTKAQFLARQSLPPKLFSHSDQMSTWLSLQPEGAATGWGGRMGDLLASANHAPVFTAMSTTSSAVFLTGRTVSQYQLGLDGPVPVRALGADTTFGSDSVRAVLQRSLSRGAEADAIAGEYGSVMRRSIETTQQLQAAMAQVAIPALNLKGVTLGNAPAVIPANDSLSRQLRLVAKLIGAGQRVGLKRQVFMVSMGGFDTHANQMRDQPALMARAALAIDYFLGAVQAQGLLDNVLLFTASDFGRTLVSNGDGSDHGWGSHHLVAGGGLRGADIHGRFPITATGTVDDIGSGRLLPGIAVSELAGTLGGWMGLSRAEQEQVLPGLNYFTPRSLGFL